MADKQNNGRVTIANIVSIVGLVLLLVFSVLGHSYKSGGEFGWDILIPIVITAIVAFLLWLLIKAKGAENDLKKWRKVEWGALVAYVVVAVVSLFCSGFVQFFAVNDKKDTIKEYAKNDLEKIEKLFSNYEKFEQTAIEKTETGLRLAIEPGHTREAELSDFFVNNGIDVSQSGIKALIDNQRSILLGEDYQKFHDDFKNNKNEIENVVNKWNVLFIGVEAPKIIKLATSVKDGLNERSKEAKLPNVHPSGGSYHYVLGEMQFGTFDVAEDEFEFKKALQGEDGFCPSAIIVFIIIHLMILFNYIVAYRTKTLGVRKHLEDDGGIILKN